MAEVEKQILSGDIVGVSKAAHTVKIQSGEGSSELRLDEDTTITVNGNYRAISDLAPGQKIRKIYYVDRNGGKLATIIHAVDEKLMAQQKKKKVTSEAIESKPAI